MPTVAAEDATAAALCMLNNTLRVTHSSERRGITQRGVIVDLSEHFTLHITPWLHYFLSQESGFKEEGWEIVIEKILLAKLLVLNWFLKITKK